MHMFLTELTRMCDSFSKAKWTQMFLYFRTCPSKWTGFVSVAAHWAYVHFSVSGMKNHVIQFNLSSNAKGPFYVGMKKKIQIFFILNSFFYVDTKSWQKEVNFRKENKLLFVWQVTVMHSMQAGHMDKAQKYTDKALMQIEKLKSKPALFF